MFTPELMWQCIVNQSYSSFVIAYSGGMDSHVLLHAFSRLQKTLPHLKIRAIHIHHGLYESATHWENHCRCVCAALDIPFTSRQINVLTETGDSLEAKAREARYQALIQSVSSDECLVTGHTRNDQVETVLLQLLRGAGPKGLAAMPNKKSISKTHLLRPLLYFSREDLLHYAREQDLKWIEDNSNQDNRFDRNFLRNNIVPLLEQRWPGMKKSITRTAELCAETIDLMNDLADLDLVSIYSDDQKTLKNSELLRLSEHRQRNVLRRWFDLRKITQPNSKKLRQIQKSILQASSDATPLLCWQQTALRRYRDYLYLCPMKKTTFDYSSQISWDFTSILKLPAGLGELTVSLKKGKGVKTDIDQSKITIRFRQGGEICKVFKKQPSKPLKKLFQEWGVPTWMRRQIPLIYCGERLIAVPGYWICADFSVEKDEIGFYIQLTNT